MGHTKDINTKVKQDIVKLLSDGKTTFEIAKTEIREKSQKEIENIVKMRT